MGPGSWKMYAWKMLQFLFDLDMQLYFQFEFKVFQ